MNGLGEYGGDYRKLSYRDLYQQTSMVAAAMRAEGVVSGDVVAAYAANCPEVVIWMLAATSMGAQLTTIPPEFGVAAVKDRLVQTQPKLILASSAVFYNGRPHDQMSKIRELTGELVRLQRIILLPSAWSDENQEGELMRSWDQFITTSSRPSPPSIEFTQLPFNHPLYILYSSGTTGRPKCLVHSAGGTLLQHLKEHHLHGDLTREDVFLQYTTIGWMMWHWLVSALALGCTIVLYEGSPFRPSPDQLWLLMAKHGITRFGTSAKYIQTLQETSFKASPSSVAHLKTIYSTGSPLSVADFRYLYTSIKSDLQVASITGGTDIISLFGAPNPLLPVRAGEIQSAGLGMAIAAFSEEGKPCVQGEPGDLVCKRPFPCQPIYFLEDDQRRSRYRSAYFERFPGVWHHGDFVQFSPVSGGLIMLGRSDGTLNPAGVRFGSAELYNVLSAFPDIEDSLAVGVRRPEETDERVIVFLKTASKKVLTEELIGAIRQAIRIQLSPRHVPARIIYTPAVPYTLNGKKVEVAVKRILSGNEVVPSTALANPEALDFYRELAKTLP